jgi:putative transposase
MVNQIRSATNGNLALGNDRFLNEISSAPGRRVTRRKPGRPAKPAAPESQGN